MQAGLTADCTGLSLENGKLLQTRPAFGNSLMADIESRSPVQMATVRPGTFAPAEKPVTAQLTREEFSASQVAVEILEHGASQAEQPLQQADIILAGGAGIGSREGFEKLEQLAKRLGAVVAASRNAVDAGYAPYRCQVGMTGVTVCPKLYIAVGISGAVQHLSGMSGSGTVIAINSDPGAPIFNYADYGIVGVWETIIDQLLEELS
jgi:electron transfer flavoprotein alpha subunit